MPRLSSGTSRVSTFRETRVWITIYESITITDYKSYIDQYLGQASNTSRLRKSAPILNSNSDLPVLLSKRSCFVFRTVTSLSSSNACKSEMCDRYSRRWSYVYRSTRGLGVNLELKIKGICWNTRQSNMQVKAFAPCRHTIVDGHTSVSSQNVNQYQVWLFSVNEPWWDNQHFPPLCTYWLGWIGDSNDMQGRPSVSSKCHGILI